MCGILTAMFGIKRVCIVQDGCTTEKMAEGLRAFISDTDKLEAVIRAHPSW
jgi:hypothetical protein